MSSGNIVNLADFRPAAPEPTMTHEEWIEVFMGESVKKTPRAQLLKTAHRLVRRGRPDHMAAALAIMLLVRHLEGIGRRLRKIERADRGAEA